MPLLPHHTRLVLLLLSALLVLSALPAAAGRRSVRRHGKVLEDIFSLSDTIGRKAWHYTAQYYYRGAVDLRKKNIVIISTSNRRYYMKGGRELLTEVVGDVDYHAPNTTTRKVRHINSAVGDYDVDHGYIMDFFNLNIHGPYLLGDHILSPLRRRNAYWYRYRCDSVRGAMVYFSFKRKRRNMQLVDGHFAYDKARHRITTITFRGRYNFISFNETVTMGTEGWEQYWPKHVDMDFRYWYYGNDFRGRTAYTLNYTTLDPAFTMLSRRDGGHDLTEYYALSLDTVPALRDSSFIAAHRPVPLTADDRRIYDEHRPVARDTVAVVAQDTTLRRRSTPQWIRTLGTIGEYFFKDYDIMATNYRRLRIRSPQFIYHGSRGVSYRQDVEYTRYMTGGRWWSIAPRGSYFFKTHELTARLRSQLLFAPRHQGSVTFEGGIQNITASDELMAFNKIIANGTDTVRSLDFKDYYCHIDVSREIINGLDISAGIVMHHRRPLGFARDHREELGLRRRYRSFAPRITVTYTPGQYYYRAGNRKIVTGSAWPTFTLNYERGFKNILGSTSKYEKWEAMASHGFVVTPMHRLIWKVGGGMFTNKAAGDFVQYEYFNNGITAYNWDDDRSGVFQLLDQKYYNNSYHYLRGHLVLESPMIILGNFSTRVVRSERLYVSALMTEGLVPYLEFGYGVSNELLDVSFFTSYIKGENLKTALKFTLHIFD